MVGMNLATAQRERAIGVLIGQAYGDALGVPYEHGRPPADGHPVMKGGGLGGYAPGEWSDDTQMALCIAEVAASGLDLTTEQGLDAVATRFRSGTRTNAPMSGSRPAESSLSPADSTEHRRCG